MRVTSTSTTLPRTLPCMGSYLALKATLHGKLPARHIYRRARARTHTRARARTHTRARARTHTRAHTRIRVIFAPICVHIWPKYWFVSVFIIIELIALHLRCAQRRERYFALTLTPYDFRLTLALRAMGPPLFRPNTDTLPLWRYNTITKLTLYQATVIVLLYIIDTIYIIGTKADSITSRKLK